MFSDTATPDIKSHYAFRIFGESQEQPGGTRPVPTRSWWWCAAQEPGLPWSLGAHHDHILSGFLCLSLDFDDDGTLNREDLSHLVNCLTGQGEDTRLSASEMKQLIDNVSSQARPGSGREGLGLGLKPSLPQILEESDIDRDGTINLSEFQHVISRSPDFARYDGSGSPAFWFPLGPHLLHLSLECQDGRQQPGCESPSASQGLRAALPKGLREDVGKFGVSPSPPLPAENPTHSSLFSSFKIVL